MPDTTTTTTDDRAATWCDEHRAASGLPPADDVADCARCPAEPDGPVPDG